ncbi:WYL domain-containing protein [Thiomicrospira microaerophila]|uniref:helix-turn-helix transcriptional regulator n=1 Tax=Thiomicrospira microaerophila TaxID=406020 RepID=UPI00200D505F|nr:WYL domain-containing protein [Thiomicrospira microaerophila]UQB43156.1 WYL domain-containing protein [Thiomicrospira microaerophila]
MNDACYRRIQMLRLIPKSPSRICVSELHDKLVNQGFDIDKRSVQRDVNSLAQLFAIENDGNKDIPGWYWRKDAQKLELPEMEPAVALSFKMVRHFLDRFMPPSALDDLGDYFAHADRLLAHLPNNHLADWSDKVAWLSRSQPLLSPQIQPEVLAQIYQALLSDQKLKADYQPRGEESREYTINPLGLVVVDRVIYLVGTLWDYQDIKQFALHRFNAVELSNEPSKVIEGFSLPDYIAQGAFEYSAGEQTTLALKLRIVPIIAQHLSETPLAEDQIISQIETEQPERTCYYLSATVKNTQQLRWWLMSFGAGIEVLEPPALREEFAATAQKLSLQYQTGS